MFAVLKTGGKQYKVQAGDVLRVEKLDAAAGDKIQFNDILMVGTTIGVPMVAGAAVQAEVIDQIKGEKVIHYVKRRRNLTLVRVTDVLAAGADKTGVKVAIGTVAARIAAHEAPGATKAEAPAAKAAKPAKAAKAAPVATEAAEKPKRAAKAAAAPKE